MKRSRGSLPATGGAPPPPAKLSRSDSCAAAPSSDTEAALLRLKDLFPVEKFGGKLPAIVMKHMTYSLVEDRTRADRELMSLRDSGMVRVLKLGPASIDYAVVFAEDYARHVKTHLGDSALCRKFLGSVLPGCHDVSVARQRLIGELKVTEEEVFTLVKGGVLVVRDVGRSSSWWFSVPGVSPFTKSYNRGRAMVIQMMKRAKFKEVLQKDLQERKMTVSKLGMAYHVHDIIGSEAVECIDTTSGTLLRLVEEEKAAKAGR